MGAIHRAYAEDEFLAGPFGALFLAGLADLRAGAFFVLWRVNAMLLDR